MKRVEAVTRTLASKLLSLEGSVTSTTDTVMTCESQKPTIFEQVIKQMGRHGIIDGSRMPCRLSVSQQSKNANHVRY